MNWKEFQHLTAQIFRQVGCNAEVDSNVKGIRTSHAIDVWVNFYSHGLQTKWIIECKHWDTNIPKEKVFALRSIVDDVGADKGIIVSNKGFQSGAIKAAANTNIKLLTMAELKSIIAASVVPYIEIKPGVTFSAPTTKPVDAIVYKTLRNPNDKSHPSGYREYLLGNASQVTQKAAATGLSKINNTESVLLLVERLGNFWGLGAIESTIKALSKLGAVGGILGLCSTLLLDSRTYYDKLEAVMTGLEAIGDGKSMAVIQSILDNKVPKSMEASHRMRKQVPNEMNKLMLSDNQDVVHGASLASFYNSSMWAEEVSSPDNIADSIDYANNQVKGLIAVLSNIDLTQWYRIHR